MNSEGKIGIYEATCFTSIILVNKIFFTSVGNIVYQTGTSAWYTTLLSCLTTLVFFLFIYLLLKRFPGKDLIGIYEDVTGKIIGKTISLVICGYILFNAGSTLREFLEMIKVYNLPYTPTSIIMATFLLVSVVISYYGLQTLSRICALCFVPAMIGLALILLLALPSYNINLLNPMGGHGIPKTLYYGVMRSSAYFEFILPAFVINSVNGHKAYKKIGVISILLAGGIFSISLLCYLMIFGYSTGGESISGIFELSRSIYFNRFIQRLESIFLFTWVISSVITTTASYYMGLLLYCKTFRIKDHKPLLFPFAVIVYMIAILPLSMQEVVQKNIAFLREYSMFFMYIPPILVLLLAVLLKKKGGGANA